VVQVKSIYGARQLELDDEPWPQPSPSPTLAQEAKPKVKTVVQLLRPAYAGDASVLAAPLVDGRFDVVRDFAPIEKCLRDKPGALFRAVAALGKTGSGRSTLLSAALECHSAKPSVKFPANASTALPGGQGVDVYIQAARRIFAVKVRLVSQDVEDDDLASRGLELLATGVSLAQLAHALNVRAAFCALASCQVVLVVVEDGEALDGALSPLRAVVEAMALVRARSLACARVVVARNKVAAGFSGTRRVQADERVARAMLACEDEDDRAVKVVHVPSARQWTGHQSTGGGDDGGELDAALFALRRALLGDFQTPVRLTRSNGDAVDKPSELDWLAVVVQLWGESKSQAFTVY